MGGRGTGVFLKGSEEGKKISLKNAGMKKNGGMGDSDTKKKGISSFNKKNID